MAAVVTLLEMAAENSGPTDLYRGHGAALRRAERSAVLLTIGFAVAACQRSFGIDPLSVVKN